MFSVALNLMNARCTEIVNINRTFVVFISDKSVSQVALRWLLQKDIVSSVIIGVTSLNQLEDNIGAATGWKLTEDEVNTKLNNSQLSLIRVCAGVIQISLLNIESSICS